MPSFSQILAQSVTDAGVQATVVYATAADLPLVGNTAGDIALVSETNRLYIFTGSGQYNVALINTNPTIITAPDGSYVFATDGTPIVITLQAQDPEEVPIAWTYVVTSGALGSTATVSQADNVFTITPSVNEVDAGTFSITFTASDGVNLATAASSFTLLFGTEDQYYNYSSILLKSGSTAGLNNTTFVDESTNGFTVTPTGDVYQGSLSPYSPAGWSAYFDGTGDYLDIPGDAAAFGTSDYTVEGWHYYTGAAATNTRFLIDCRQGGGSGSLLLFFENAIYKLYIGGHVANGGTLVKDAWQHFALVRSSGSTKLYVNGTSVFTWADSTNYASTQVRLGRDTGNNDSLSWVGYMSDIRIVKGTAVYTSNFTPPTEPLTAISGTSLLTCQSNRFIDNSTNNFTITKYGDTKAVPFSPYIPSEKYDPTVHGGSAYFDDVGDYLTIPNSEGFQFGTGDFTIEFWINRNNADGSIISINQSAGAGAWAVVISGGQLYFQSSVAAASLLYPFAIQAGVWTHCAWTREGGVNRAFINGVKRQEVTSAINYVNTNNLLVGTAPSTYGEYAGYIGDLRVVKGTAVYTADFTPPTQSLTAISGTSLLLNMNNTGIYDEMAKNNIKMVGNTTTSTTQTKYSDTSVYFDGAADWIDLYYSANLILSSAFTIEAWVFLSSSQSNQTLFNMTPPHSTIALSLNRGGTGSTHVYVGNGSSWVGSPAINSGGNTIAINQWYHVALTSDGTTLRLFHNGIIVGTSTTLPSGFQGYARIGAINTGVYGAGGNEYFNGYMEDFRITNGVARYTANFTPPTAPLGFSNAE